MFMTKKQNRQKTRKLFSMEEIQQIKCATLYSFLTTMISLSLNLFNQASETEPQTTRTFLESRKLHFLSVDLIWQLLSNSISIMISLIQTTSQQYLSFGKLIQAKILPRLERLNGLIMIQTSSFNSSIRSSMLEIQNT